MCPYTEKEPHHECVVADCSIIHRFFVYQGCSESLERIQLKNQGANNVYIADNPSSLVKDQRACQNEFHHYLEKRHLRSKSGPGYFGIKVSRSKEQTFNEEEDHEKHHH